MLCFPMAYLRVRGRLQFLISPSRLSVAFTGDQNRTSKTRWHIPEQGGNVTKKFSIEPAYFDLKGLHAYSGGAISVRKLRALLKQPDGLPHFRVGRKVLVAKSDFDAWVQRFRREPIDLDALVDEILSDFFPDRKKKK
jgi:hypothetical protein